MLRSKKTKVVLTISTIILVGLIGFKLFSNWTKSVMQGKPPGQYYSAKSIKEAKESNAWKATFLPRQQKHFSSNKLDSFLIDEVWVEENRNDKEIYWEESDFEYILNVFFNQVTENDLHKFRLILSTPFRLNEYVQIEHPDGCPRVRFLLNDINDTIRIEVIERNPTDSLNWMTEKVIDTITVIKQ